jgi:uncharacterized ParB-like nuclease family protein
VQTHNAHAAQGTHICHMHTGMPHTCSIQSANMPHSCTPHTSICTLHASCQHMIFTLCACHTHAACTRHAHFTNGASMLQVPHMRAYAGYMHAAHTPLRMSYTPHACDIHPACTHQTYHTHITNLSYAHCTCTAYFPLACHMKAQAYYMQEPHCMHTRCMRGPRKQHLS